MMVKRSIFGSSHLSKGAWLVLMTIAAWVAVYVAARLGHKIWWTFS